VNSNMTTDITVKELLDRYPQLLQMFMDMELMCVGCPTEAFLTLSDVSREYHLNLNNRIYKVIGDDKASNGLSTSKAMSEQPKTKNNVT
jgi:hybrid cluster-associated redox disulfide protein